MTSWRDQRGGGTIKVVIVLALVGYGIMVGIKLIPAAADDKTIEKKTEEILKFAGVNRKEVKDIRYDLAKEARLMSLAKDYKPDGSPVPLVEDDFDVSEQGNQWHVKFSYKRQIPLIVWTYRKDFTIEKTANKG